MPSFHTETAARFRELPQPIYHAINLIPFPLLNGKVAPLRELSLRKIRPLLTEIRTGEVLVQVAQTATYQRRKDMTHYSLLLTSEHIAQRQSSQRSRKSRSIGLHPSECLIGRRVRLCLFTQCVGSRIKTGDSGGRCLDENDLPVGLLNLSQKRCVKIIHVVSAYVDLLLLPVLRCLLSSRLLRLYGWCRLCCRLRLLRLLRRCGRVTERVLYVI